MHVDRGGASLRTGDFESCLRDCGVAIYGKDDCVEAWVYKAKALHGLGRHDEALAELEPLMNQWGAGNEQIRNAYEHAQFESRKAGRFDYYKLFGLPTICSDMEIRKQYKVKAMEYHPDKWMEAEEAERKVAEENFKMLGEALEVSLLFVWVCACDCGYR